MKRVLTILLIAVFAIILSTTFIACDKKVEIPDGTNISIMSYNIRQNTATDTKTHAWSYRKPYLVEHIKEQAPTILCMQEVKKNQYQYIKEQTSETYDVIWYSRTVDESQEGLAIAYDKTKLELISKDMFWLSNTPDKESKGFGAPFLRICVHGVFKEIETQREISIYCVHLEVASESAREKEIQMIIDRVKADDKEAIVCGDFNTTKDSECYSKISEIMTSTQDSAINTEYGITYQDFGGKSITFDSSIDFIFTTSGFFAKDFNILDEHKEIDGQAVYYSDHYAVKADVVFKN